MRAISIFLIIAIALQTVGCTTMRPLARVNEVSEDNRQSSMRDQVLGKLTEGMRVRIRIREGARAPIKVQVIECIVEKIGLTSLTVTPITIFFVRTTARKEFALQYSDIVSIEYRQVLYSTVFVGGVVVGAILGFYFSGFIIFHQLD